MESTLENKRKSLKLTTLGFTLIELLAVIVILAIIALIATPIVLDIINDSKDSSVLRSADFYLDGVELSMADRVMNHGGITDGTYNILENGNICLEEYDEEAKECKDNDTKLDNNELKVEVDGEVPTSGTITIISGQISDISLNLSNKVIGKNNKGELVFGVKLVNYIKNLYKETTTATVNNIEYSLDETHLLMNDRLGSLDVGKLEGNIRYYGASPNNYIDIGDRDSEGNIIFWRIIGLFKNIEVTDEEGTKTGEEDLVKIVRANSLTLTGIRGFVWDYTSTGEFANDWNDATLQILLNDAYYNSTSTVYYNGSTIAKTLNFASMGLSSTAHKKIERVNWKLGRYNGYAVYNDFMYGVERLGTDSLSENVGLIYPSDYGYSSDLKECQTTLDKYDEAVCTSTNWMYGFNSVLWTITSHSTSSTTAFGFYVDGRVGHHGIKYWNEVRPVLYLKSNVSVVEEKETSEGLKYLVVE